MTLRPGRYRFKVDYIGAMDASCEPEELMIDDSTARRLLVIKQDTSRPDGVTVIAKKRPFLMFDPVQAKVIGFPRGQVTKEEK